jgi:hypothetical protein
MLWLFLITPLLGSLRNYVKYKNLKFLLFIRTPLTYFILSLFFYRGKSQIWKIIVLERWFFFAYKTLLSLYNNDYHIKKEKYKIKYGLVYDL